MKVQPRTLKGFRDFLPAAMIPRERLMETARQVYRSYGFSPIDTPTLEYLEILLGKGSDETDRQLYRFEDNGGRQVGMRFDLTVPLARFAAQHIQQLGTPFKRYHIAPVWRGENTHRGRYREFVQCDFDTIGTTSIVADIETVLVIHDLMHAIGVDNFTIRINNRKVLNGLLNRLGLHDQSTAILRAMDKLPKVGAQKVAEELTTAAGTNDLQNQDILTLATLHGDHEQILVGLKSTVQDDETGVAGLEALSQVVHGATAAGVAADKLQIDPSIARGLDYYTGTIVETFLNDLPDIGSVCSGGRYDNLAEVYTNQELPGIGASLGLDRLLAALTELSLIETVSTPAPVLVTYFDRDQRDTYLRIAATVRAAGIGVELYPDPKKLGVQLKYASQRGFRIALIAGEDELSAGKCQVKDLANRESYDASLEGMGADSLLETIRRILRSEP
ncbi:MAG: histidine--tRNA ligase [Planctomycetales bacterium]|nr:histidine--tRNA ligase [Planctomycetales bacterium]